MGAEAAKAKTLSTCLNISRFFFSVLCHRIVEQPVEFSYRKKRRVKGIKRKLPPSYVHQLKQMLIGFLILEETRDAKP